MSQQQDAVQKSDSGSRGEENADSVHSINSLKKRESPQVPGKMSRKFQSQNLQSQQSAAGLSLSPQTQQTIMEIIQTLRHNTSPDALDQLFQTLTETSEVIEGKSVKQDEPEEVLDEQIVEEEAKKKDKTNVLPIEDQLKILLEKLNSNTKLRRGGEKIPNRLKNDQNQDLNAQQIQSQINGVMTAQQGQLITHAYHLINEVIMYPQIMWTRNFFYSLGAMTSQHQQIMHDWFSEMNEKQQIYIKEIERANDQLKQTAQDLFQEKGYSREQTELFLKKVNFMENREYFFHKRRAMTQMRDPSENASAPIADDGTEIPVLSSDRERVGNKKAEASFFDTMSSSCRLQGMESDLSTVKTVRFTNPKQEQRGARTVIYHDGRGEKANSRGRGHSYYRHRQSRKQPPKVWSGHKFNHRETRDD